MDVNDADIYRALVGRRTQVNRPLRVPSSNPMLGRWRWLNGVVAGAARRVREAATRLGR
jgi:hypothetical protein